MQPQKAILAVIFMGLLLVTWSCSRNEEVINSPKLELIASYSINVAEPSGLAINEAGTTLYTVSDNTNKIYKISTIGDVIQTYNYVGNDLEGITTFTENKLLLAEERTKEIVEYDMRTGNFSKHRILYDNNDENSGLEGVSFNTNDNTIFVLNEKNPGLLIRLRNDYSVIEEYPLIFASDYSGIFHESATNNLWIVSDQNKTVNKCNLRGALIKSYSINVTKAEGIVVVEDKIYVISDTESKLFVFNKPSE